MLSLIHISSCGSYSYKLISVDRHWDRTKSIMERCNTSVSLSLIHILAYHIEPKRMRLVYPFVDKEPNMVLIEGLRGGKSRLTVEKPLIVYKEPGVYMPEIYDIYGY